MAGKIKKIIDSLIEQRAKGNTIIAGSMKVRLCLKGINPDKFTALSADDPLIIEKLINLAKELNLKIN